MHFFLIVFFTHLKSVYDFIFIRLSPIFCISATMSDMYNKCLRIEVKSEWNIIFNLENMRMVTLF